MSLPAQERPSPDAMSVDEIAAAYNVEKPMVLRRIREGELRPLNAPKTMAKRVRMYWISRHEVERYMAAHRAS